MKTKHLCKSVYVIIIFLFAIVLKASSQDAHFSQYDASPIVLNPALTGMFKDGDFRVSSQYRNQWGAIASNLTTTTLSFDLPLQKRWGVGGYILNSDEARYFNVFNFLLSGAYEITTPDQDKHKLTVGLQFGIICKNTKDYKLVFDNQYYDGNFDPDLPNSENLEQNNLLMPEVNYGILYATIEKGKTINPYGGFSIFHITSPKESFYRLDDFRLPRKYVLHGGAFIKITDKIKLDPKFLLMRQTNATEINVGLRGYYQLPNSDITLIGGAFYRVKDAVIPVIGINYKNFIYKMSYDINTSSLKEYSRGRGGLEFSLVFFNGMRTSLAKNRPIY